jgi:hypothetical protein
MPILSGMTRLNIVRLARPDESPPPRAELVPNVRAFPRQLRELRQALPAWLSAYLSAIGLLMALLMWWMPVSDYDSWTSYLARIYLERMGPLRETATLELQYQFPKFFDYLHAPLLDWGWFQTLPTFTLFSVLVASVIWRFPTPMAARLLLGLAISAPVLCAVTSAKNDLAFAIFTFLCWLWIFEARTDAPWYMAVGMLLIAAMIGTKWHSFFVAPPLACMLAARVIRRRAWSLPNAFLLCCALPLAWYISSADVYLENLRLEGSICPKADYLVVAVRPLRNLASFTVNGVLETFEVPFYFCDCYCFGGKLWPLLQSASWHGKNWNYAIMPNCQLAVFGFPILAVLVCSVVAACRRTAPVAIRAAALIALIYAAACLCSFHYESKLNRYFLTTYLLGLVPTAYLLQSYQPRGLWRKACCAYLIFVSLHAMLFNHERLLVPFKRYTAETLQSYNYPSLFVDLGDRDMLYFHVWEGHRHPYRVFRESVRSYHRVLIVNGHHGNDVPFLGPFVRHHHQPTTRVVSPRFGQAVPDRLSERFDYVLAFRSQVDDVGFRSIYDSDDVRLYQNVQLAAQDAGAPDSTRHVGE